MEGEEELLLALTANLHITHIAVVAGVLCVSALAVQAACPCPLCGQESQHIHSRYRRVIADVPCGSQQVSLHLEVRKFFCRTVTCPRHIFTERLPALVQPSARMTNRLRILLQAVGLAAGAEAGSRLAGQLGVRITPPTLLRCLRRTPILTATTVRVLGLDDWSYKRGQTFGTILVDLERHRVIDLLPDRRSETVQMWLEKHPEVEIISRDRASGYADAARKAAPQAIQVADRFHLVKNLREKLQALLDRKRTCLPYKEEKKPVPSPSPLLSPQAVKERKQSNKSRKKKPMGRYATDPALTANERQRLLNREKRYERYVAVKALRTQGLSHYDIADALGVSRATVRSFLQAKQFPERRDAPRDPQKSVVAPSLPFLQERWRAGCHNGRQLFREVKARGYAGSLRQIERLATQWRTHFAPDAVPMKPKRQRIASQQACWYFLLSQERLNAEQGRYLAHLRQASPDLAFAYELSQNFLHLLREQKAEELNSWLRQARESSLPEFRSLATSMQQDLAAVTAACSLPWNQGQVEGQINRLKWLKRQMYGRARFDLLRLRVLVAS